MSNQRKMLEDIKEDISLIRIDLNHHIKRTDMLEAEFKPIKTHVAVVGALSKILVALFAMGAASAAIWRTWF